MFSNFSSYLFHEWRTRKFEATAVHLPVSISAADIDLDAIKSTFLNIKAVQCKCSLQQNSYDCGVFVTQYAEDVLTKWPCSNERAIHSKFEEFIKSDDFTQQDITEKRLVIITQLIEE